MANTIDQAFIKQFETEVHLAYQRMGSKLRNTVRTAGNVRGNIVRFQKIGTGSANTKSRNGNVTPMELAHTNVEVTMADFYAAEFIDKLDELKTNINERQAVAQSAAAARDGQLVHAAAARPVNFIPPPPASPPAPPPAAAPSGAAAWTKGFLFKKIGFEK